MPRNHKNKSLLINNLPYYHNLCEQKWPHFVKHQQLLLTQIMITGADYQWLINVLLQCPDVYFKTNIYVCTVYTVYIYIYIYIYIYTVYINTVYICMYIYIYIYLSLVVLFNYRQIDAFLVSLGWFLCPSFSLFVLGWSSQSRFFYSALYRAMWEHIHGFLDGCILCL